MYYEKSETILKVIRVPRFFFLFDYTKKNKRKGIKQS